MGELVHSNLTITLFHDDDNILFQSTNQVPHTAKHSRGKTFMVTRKNTFRWKNFVD